MIIGVGTIDLVNNLFLKITENIFIFVLFSFVFTYFPDNQQNPGANVIVANVKILFFPFVIHHDHWRWFSMVILSYDLTESMK